MSRDLALAVRLLQAGELVAFPTETVYGIGADAANPAAVARIFAAKGRPADHPLIVHLPGAGHLDRWARDVPAAAWELAEAFWPGPLTLILKRAPGVPGAVTGGQDTVGVRVPAHPLALALLRAYAQAGGVVWEKEGLCGIAAPSANRFGRISPTCAAHVREELGDAAALVLDGGPCPVGIESTILDLSRDDPYPPRLLRPGHVSLEQIETVLGVLPEAVVGQTGQNVQEPPRVSGSLDAHYAPTTPMRMVASQRLPGFLDAQRDSGRRCAVLCHSQPPQAGLSKPSLHLWQRLPAQPEAYARGLYAALRALDKAGVELIVVEDLPVGPAWTAVADRLRRAACGAGGA
ncbi:MAG: threonylcarbamoyl-AMP synthase [Betaproteobacteria bacterium]|nr:threonylcarbamoyl-AMP synthase [Betaproteobacteria bacterium]